MRLTDPRLHEIWKRQQQRKAVGSVSMAVADVDTLTALCCELDTKYRTVLDVIRMIQRQVDRIEQPNPKPPTGGTR